MCKMCVQLENQVAYEQSANFGLAGRVQHLEGEAAAKDTLDRLSSPKSRAAYNAPPSRVNIPPPGVHPLPNGLPNTLPWLNK